MLKYYKYRLPFKNAFRIAGNKFTHRVGIVLVFQDKANKIEAYGEIAPLPGFSSETVSQIEEVLKMNRELLQESLTKGNSDDVLQVIDQIHQFPSLSFGIDTLIHDLAAKRAKKPLVNYLFPDFRATLRSNGVLPIQDTQSTLETARQLINEGFETLKVKIGRDFKTELGILKKLRADFPHIGLRIDANQSWSVKEAIRNLNTLKSLDIEYCEQPVSSQNTADLKTVKESVEIPVAADESVRNKSQAIEVSVQNLADILILKPMLLGTFKNINVTIRAANTHNIVAVLTTLLEGGIGRAATAALTAGLGSANRAHGLATGRLLKEDLTSDNWMDKPEIIFPKSPGLGILINLEGLKEF